MIIFIITRNIKNVYESLKSLKYFLKTKSTNCLEFIYSPEAKISLNYHLFIIKLW
jgi:hypothetical protein